MNRRPSYLEELTIRLATGLGHVPQEVRGRHGEFLTAAQRPDGGFAGRLGQSDLYYTSFALRGLAILGELYGPVAERTMQFLRSRLDSRETLIDLMSLVYGAALIDASAGLDVFADSSEGWKDALADRLNQLRCGDGGFAKGPGGTASSTYHTFLALLCLQLIGRPVSDADRVVRFILSQRAELGGFREIRASKRAGTNPTAAAIGVLRLLDALDDEVRASTADFLAEMQDDDGGLLANSRIPIADVLSTFTGLLTLADLGDPLAIDRAAALTFVRSIEQPHGGFFAAVWDEVCDVEYTFYGLGCLALLTPPEA